MSRALHRLDADTVDTPEDLHDVIDAIGPAIAVDALLVVGPFARVGSDLHEMVRRARARDDTYRSLLDALGRRHLAMLDALPAAAQTPTLTAQIQDDTRDLADTCHALRSGGDTDVARALALSCGALWSSRIVAAHLRARGVEARWRDPHEVLRVGAPDALRAAPADALAAPWREADEGCTVVPGGRALDTREAPVHLHPDGLDRSAVLLAVLLPARAVTLWHRDAPSRTDLSLAEASALADVDPALGAPALWAAALDAGIPVAYRNLTADPPAALRREAPGPRPRRLRVRRDLSLIVVIGTALHEFPHAARAMAQCLRDADATPTLLMLATPGEPLAALVAADRADAAVDRLRRSFLWEDHARHAQDVRRIDDVALFRLLGLRAHADLYVAITRAGGEVVAVAQAPLGVSLSLVLRATDLDALEASIRDALGAAP